MLSLNTVMINSEDPAALTLSTGRFSENQGGTTADTSAGKSAVPA